VLRRARRRRAWTRGAQIDSGPVVPAVCHRDWLQVEVEVEGRGKWLCILAPLPLHQHSPSPPPCSLPLLLAAQPQPQPEPPKPWNQGYPVGRGGRPCCLLHVELVACWFLAVFTTTGPLATSH
jgi:hypothetical protein